MHDTYLCEKICAEVMRLCGEKKINELNSLTIGVHKNSHVTEESLAALLKMRSLTLMGDATRIQVIRDETEENTAVIRSIDGLADCP